jgi:hypothetical protein
VRSVLLKAHLVQAIEQRLVQLAAEHRERFRRRIARGRAVHLLHVHGAHGLWGRVFYSGPLWLLRSTSARRRGRARHRSIGRTVCTIWAGKLSLGWRRHGSDCAVVLREVVER